MKKQQAICIICGTPSDRVVFTQKHPDRPVCLSCLNQLIFNLKTIEEELEPLAEAVEKEVDAIDDDLGKAEGKGK